MPVKEFNGTLDKPKVKEFAGKLDPDETALYGRKLPEARALPPEDNRLGSTQESVGKPRGIIGMFTDEMPGFQMPNPQGNPAHRKYILGGLGSMVPGGILAQSLLGGAGYAAGMASEQSRKGEIDPLSVAAESGGFAGGTLAGGLLFKGLGAIANKIFVSAPEEQALNFAVEKGAPYMEPRAQIGRSGLAGDLALRGKAKQAVGAINRAMADVTKGVRSLDAADDALDMAAANARGVLDDYLSPGSLGIKEPLQNIRGALGDDFTVSPNQTAHALLGAKEYLVERLGITKGAVFRRIDDLIKNADKPKSIADLDEIYGDLWQLWNKKANRSTRKAVDMISGAIVNDIDEAAKAAGYANFGDDFAVALAKREKFRELTKKYPEFRKLMNISPDKTRIWTDTMFNSSGEALKELRKISPEKYDDLANAYLARNIYTRTKDSNFGKTLDGRAFSDWVEGEKQTLKNIFGDRYKAIQGLAKYAESVGKTTNNMQGLRPEEVITRLGAETASAYFSPGLVVGNELGSFVLAKGLTNPESWLFGLATKGIPKGASATLGAVPKIGGGVAGAEMMP